MLNRVRQGFGRQWSHYRCDDGEDGVFVGRRQQGTAWSRQRRVKAETVSCWNAAEQISCQVRRLIR